MALALNDAGCLGDPRVSEDAVYKRQNRWHDAARNCDGAVLPPWSVPEQVLVVVEDLAG